MLAIDSDPEHLAPALKLVGADDRFVVLCLTGDGAGAAADAGIEVDDHAPGVAKRRKFGIEARLLLGRVGLDRPYRAGIGDGLVPLGADEASVARNLADLNVMGRPRRIGCAQTKRVGADLRADRKSTRLNSEEQRSELQSLMGTPN